MIKNVYFTIKEERREIQFLLRRKGVIFHLFISIQYLNPRINTLWYPVITNSVLYNIRKLHRECDVASTRDKRYTKDWWRWRQWIHNTFNQQVKDKSKSITITYWTIKVLQTRGPYAKIDYLPNCFIKYRYMPYENKFPYKF